ncbi:hypothetical protein [Ramlibacter albus]|uniref:DUF4426 domain-containing protein n=1 Tax=Ramlibacter albus TaxID=2079448 RepID=A0A923MAY5_9BURK|nr:hypothetical protein [Ramlibacter albus]MBC5767295.1 hypothetical protein [Ramlibacter albus]
MAPLNASIRAGTAAAALALYGSLALAQAPPPGTAAATTRTTTEAGVTIKVTPVALLPIGWMFAVVLESTSSIDDNVKAQALLVAGAEQLQASEWDGAGPGGARREGVLTFPVPKADPAALELRIARKGEAAPRVFKWERADLK